MTVRKSWCGGLQRRIMDDRSWSDNGTAIEGMIETISLEIDSRRRSDGLNSGFGWGPVDSQLHWVKRDET